MDLKKIVFHASSFEGFWAHYTFFKIETLLKS